jgi:hypothetical protein
MRDSDNDGVMFTGKMERLRLENRPKQRLCANGYLARYVQINELTQQLN